MELIEILELLQNVHEELKDYSGKEEVPECRCVAQNFLKDAIGFLNTAIYGYDEEIKEQVKEAALKRPLKTPEELDDAIENITTRLRQLESEIEGWGDGNHPETWLAHNGDAHQCCLKELEAIKSDWELLIQDMTKAKEAKEYKDD